MHNKTRKKEREKKIAKTRIKTNLKIRIGKIKRNSKEDEKERIDLACQADGWIH